MEQINCNTVLKSKGSITCLPGKIHPQENIPVATYTLTATIKNNILNCKGTVQSINEMIQLVRNF